MNPRIAFIRKIVYLVIIGVLLGLLYWIGHPATVGSAGLKGSPGGILCKGAIKWD